MRKPIAIIGAGILGRSLAYRLSEEGHSVHVFESRSADDTGAASFIAGGMLAPYCELEYSPKDIATPGLKSIQILKKWHQKLDGRFWFQQEGSLVVFHPRDRAEILRLQKRLDHLGHGNSYEKKANGLFFPDEAHVHTNSLLDCLLEASSNLGCKYHFNQTKDHLENSADFLWVFDCRGMGSKSDFPKLRGIRGEVVEIETTEVNFKHPVRFMHPRYPIYIIPRPNNRFVIGATVIESEQQDPVSVRGALELLSAASTVDPAFSEAKIIALRHQVRPALPNHLPGIQISGNTVRINGLYRHGYLFSPYITEEIINRVQNNTLGDSECLTLF